MSSSLAYSSAQALSASLASGELSSVDLVEYYLQRIDEWEPRLHAYVEVYAEDARRAAQAADLARRSGAALGPLHGMPVALKDLVEIAGCHTSGGTAAQAGRISTVTAHLVRKLWQQGAIILGKTHTVEFAMGGWGTNQRLGTPWNPWDLNTARTPGGSSSGSGVALAADLVPLALGTDTGGSVRLPASWCNLTALKVSSGRISAQGVLALSPTLDTPGPMARSVADARLFYDALRGFDPDEPLARLVPPEAPARAPREDLRGLRLARLPEADRALVAPEVLSAYDAALAVLADAGADIVDVPMPYGFAEVAEINGQIMFAEGYSLYHTLLDDAAAPLDEDVRPRLLNGRNIRSIDYIQALRQRREMQVRFNKVFDQVDALLAPTTLTPPLALEDVDQAGTPSFFTRFGNFFNLSALALPCGATAQGLPLGMQIMGRPYGEDGVLDIGAQYQARTQWHLRRPQGL